MLANVSVGCTHQTTDIFVYHRHVGNVVPTRRRHSVMWANFSAVGVVSVRPIADTHSYMHVGISIDEVVTTYEDKKNWHPLRFCTHSQVLTLSKSK
jgi:predicted RNA-binding protein (virulence factor B family)